MFAEKKGELERIMFMSCLETFLEQEAADLTFTVTFRDLASTYPSESCKELKKTYGKEMRGLSGGDLDHAEQFLRKHGIDCLHMRNLRRKDFTKAKKWLRNKGVACLRMQLKKLVQEPKMENKENGETDDVEETEEKMDDEGTNEDDYYGPLPELGQEAQADFDASCSELLIVVSAMEGIESAMDKLLNRHGACEEAFADLLNLEFNEKNVTYKKKKRRHAQQSVVFARGESQKLYDPPNTDDYKPIVHNMDELPWAKEICAVVAAMTNRPELVNCVAECNRYRNTFKNPQACGVGLHGDSESNVVFAFRFGRFLRLAYIAYCQNRPRGQLLKIPALFLWTGSFYLMSKDAVGKHYKKSSLVTFRHAAGGPNYVEHLMEKKRRKREHKNSDSDSHRNQDHRNLDQHQKKKQTR